MVNSGKKALFLTALDYESPIQIGDHQLARQFAARGWHVGYISKPVTPFHFLSKDSAAIKRRLASHRANGYHYSIGNGELWSFVPFAFVIPQNIKPLVNKWVYKYWQNTIIPDLKGFLEKRGFLDVDLLYIRDPLQGNLMGLVDAKYKVFRIADNDASFLSHNHLYSRAEREVAREVDLVAYTAKKLAIYVKNLAPKKSFYIPNGVDFDFFQNRRELPNLYKTIERPIIVYAGSIDFWLDYDLINNLASSLPHYSFVVIGPNQKYGHKFIDTDNLILTGPIPHSDLPAYLTHADVGIIPFNKQDYPNLVHSISPVKLFEYMASGLPVLATKWDELENISSPAILCETREEFLSALGNIALLKKESNLSKPFAKENDWSARYDDLIKLIFSD